MKKRERGMGAHKSHIKLNLFFGFSFCLLLLPGCSSAPRPPTEIITERNTAAKQLNLANYTASQGRYNDALIILEDAWRLAVSTDDPPLRIKTSMSRGNILFSMGCHAEAFNVWYRAAAEGDASGEKVLAALARIYSIRARLVLLAGEADRADAE
jgi:tetratricopeptide (TPR) repeat protein